MISLALLAMAADAVIDPLTIILSAGGGAIIFLLGVCTTLLWRRLGESERQVKYLTETLTGTDGVTLKIRTLEGDVKAHDQAIKGLLSTALTTARFEGATADQNRRLEELKRETNELGVKVGNVNLTLASRPWSQTMPATRAPYQRQEPSSDPPIAPVMRPRLPSRPR